MPTFERELFQRVMAGEDVSVDDVVQLARERRTEGTWHDFKSGKVFDDGPKKEKQADYRRLRRTVASFANAEGGIVVIGVSEGNAADGGTGRPLECIEETNPDAVVNWLSSVLGPLVPYLNPQPRWALVICDGGTSW